MKASMRSAFLLLIILRACHSVEEYVSRLYDVIELANGVTHPTLAAIRGGYFPGTATALPLLVVAACLALRLGSGQRSGCVAA